MWSVRQTSFLVAALALVGVQARAEEEKKNELFKDVEVRVIRQKYFQKSSRIELAANFNSVMSQSFIFTMAGSAQLGYHINEQFGVFGEAGQGLTLNKSDCEILGKNFAIEPEQKFIAGWFGGGVHYTPVYGKYQLTSGDVLYFDWYFSGEGGMASTAIGKGRCNPDGLSDFKTVNVPRGAISTGQRYFISKDAAALWNIKYVAFKDPDPNATGFLYNILLSVGMSYYLL